MLGRLNFAAAAVDITKPFLGSNLHVGSEFAGIRSATSADPHRDHIQVLEKGLLRPQHVHGEAIISNGAAFKGDARASADSIGIGG